VAIPGPTQTVLINAFGQLGTSTSSWAALRTDVRALGARGDALLGLRPVSYQAQARRLAHQQRELDWLVRHVRRHR
jgi:hypothetical protein